MHKKKKTNKHLNKNLIWNKLTFGIVLNLWRKRSMEKRMFKIPIPFNKKDYVEMTPFLFIHQSIVDRFGGLDNLLDKADAFAKENKDFIMWEVFETLPNFLQQVNKAIKLNTGFDCYNRYYDENDKPSDYYTYYATLDKSTLEWMMASGDGELMQFVYVMKTMGWFFDKNLGKKEE